MVGEVGDKEARKPSSHEEEEDGGGEGGEEGGGRGGRTGYLLRIMGDVTQKPFLIPLGPHVFLTVNSVHTRPSFSLASRPVVSPNSRALMEGHTSPGPFA